MDFCGGLGRGEVYLNQILNSFKDLCHQWSNNPGCSVQIYYEELAVLVCDALNIALLQIHHQCDI